mmetsp:Transcript_114354/g.243919  ORF Transcript_114354/g.243919 Transcript_114354/m.243919 type:complete len:263 (+) Transcript_114354:1696-2484(+)
MAGLECPDLEAVMPLEYWLEPQPVVSSPGSPAAHRRSPGSGARCRRSGQCLGALSHAVRASPQRAPGDDLHLRGRCGWRRCLRPHAARLPAAHDLPPSSWVGDWQLSRSRQEDAAVPSPAGARPAMVSSAVSGLEHHRRRPRRVSRSRRRPHAKRSPPERALSAAPLAAAGSRPRCPSSPCHHHPQQRRLRPQAPEAGRPAAPRSRQCHQDLHLGHLDLGAGPVAVSTAKQQKHHRILLRRLEAEQVELWKLHFQWLQPSPL